MERLLWDTLGMILIGSACMWGLTMLLSTRMSFNLATVLGFIMGMPVTFYFIFQMWGII